MIRTPTKSHIELSEEDQKVLAEFGVGGICACDGAEDDGCPLCTEAKFYEWWADRIKLNPGIRQFVIWLNKNNFQTTDSGDGDAHDFPCDRDYPYVVVKLNSSDKLLTESKRLLQLLTSVGILGTKHRVNIEKINPETNPYINASYDPVDDLSIIDIGFINDKSADFTKV